MKDTSCFVGVGPNLIRVRFHTGVSDQNSEQKSFQRVGVLFNMVYMLHASLPPLPATAASAGGRTDGERREIAAREARAERASKVRQPQVFGPSLGPLNAKPSDFFVNESCPQFAD
jgi:hypothetical protein